MTMTTQTTPTQGRTPMAETEAERLARLRALTTSGRAREIRTAARLTGTEVARAVGADQSTISRWEAGTRNPRGHAAQAYLNLLDRLAQYTGATEGWAMTATDTHWHYWLGDTTMCGLTRDADWSLGHVRAGDCPACTDQLTRATP